MAFVLIVIALLSAGYFMVKRPPGEPGAPPSSRMAWALALRVGVSVSVFLFVLLSYWMGWIHPTGLPAGQ